MEAIPASAYQQDPNFKTGYMTKQGGRIKTWRKRFFVLDRENRMLYYYKREEDAAARGVIHLQGYSAQDGTADSGRPATFKLVRDGSRTYYIVAEDETDRDEWMRAVDETYVPPVVQTLPSMTPVSSSSSSLTQTYSSHPVPLRQTGANNSGGALGGAASFSAAAYGSSFDHEDSDDEDETIGRGILRPPAPAGPRPLPPDSRPAMPSAPAPDIPKSAPAWPVAEAPSRAPSESFSTRPPPPSKRPDPNSTMVSNSTVDRSTVQYPNSAPPELEDSTLYVPVPDVTLFSGQGPPVPSTGVIRLTLVCVNRPMSIPTVTLDLNQPFQVGRIRDSHEAFFVGLDSRVVSRKHCEIFAAGDTVYVRDIRSQSGTFVNSYRLSMPGEESSPHPLRPSDILQLGVDIYGCTEENQKSVAFRVEYVTGTSSSSQRRPELSDLTRVLGASVIK